jgi:hypothetical protein
VTPAEGQGFDFSGRFKRKRLEREETDPVVDANHDPSKDLVPVVLYCPFRCPFCRARYPKNRGSGRGDLPLHYLTCKACGREYHAQEVDHAGLLRLVEKKAGE